jgi:hypothetical protein
VQAFGFGAVAPITGQSMKIKLPGYPIDARGLVAQAPLGDATKGSREEAKR